jgi:hypothetical protein
LTLPLAAALARSVQFLNCAVVALTKIEADRWAVSQSQKYSAFRRQWQSSHGRPGPPARPKVTMPFVGQRKGRGRFAQFFSKLAEMQEAEQLEQQDFIAQADNEVAQGHYRWRIKSTGHSYASDWVHAFNNSR